MTTKNEGVGPDTYESHNNIEDGMNVQSEDLHVAEWFHCVGHKDACYGTYCQPSMT